MKKKALIDILATFTPSSPDTYSFGGVMRSPSGEFLGTVRGIVPTELLQAPKRAGGRPRAIASDMLVLAHMHMLYRGEAGEGMGLGSVKQRTAAMGKAKKGNEAAPREQSKQAAVKMKKAIAELEQVNAICITYIGDDGSRFWFAIEDGEHHIQQFPHGVQINGVGWHCRQSDKHAASYGPITGFIPTGEQ